MALIAPAGPVDDATIDRAIQRCRALDLEPVLGDAAGSRHGYLAGPDRARADDLSWAIQSSVAGIWALRGGYGAVRTLERVDLSPLRAHPKPFIGFSDNTTVHLALLREGLVSFHGPHAGAEELPPVTEAVFRAVVMTPEPAGCLALPDGVRPDAIVAGVAEGPLIGGNLSLLAATCGTRYQPETSGAILFIEDVAEPLYRIDRMLTQLRLAGVLDDVAGIAIGEFTELERSRREGDVDSAAASGGRRVWGTTLPDLLRQIVRPLGVPVAGGLPFGHGSENWTLPLGVAARLDAGAGTLELLEAATTKGRVG